MLLVVRNLVTELWNDHCWLGQVVDNSNGDIKIPIKMIPDWFWRHDVETLSASLGSWWGKSTGHLWAPLKWSPRWSFCTSFAVRLITLRDKQSECQWYWMTWSLDRVIIMWLLPTRTSRTQRVAKIKSVQKNPMFHDGSFKNGLLCQ